APGEFASTDVRPVTPNFFKTMGIPQLSGRDFSAGDLAESPQVAIVNESLVRQQYAGEDPIGKRLKGSIGRAEGGANAEIVGVFGDIKVGPLDGVVRPAVYLPHTQLPISLMTFVTRTRL